MTAVIERPAPAPDRTALDRLEAVAREQHARILELAGEIRTRFLELGARLAVVAAQRLWQPLGYASFDEYLADPEVSGDLSARELWRAVRVARIYFPGLAGPEALPPVTVLGSADSPVTVGDVQVMGITKAEMIAPVLLTPGISAAERAEWVARAKATSRRDLDKAIRERADPRVAALTVRRAWCESTAERVMRLAGNLERAADDRAVALALDSLATAVTAARAEWERGVR